LQAGSNRDQGVGYLEDGTMIVVDNAKKYIGKKIKVNITRTHQTVAGKMIFAQKIIDNSHNHNNKTLKDRTKYRTPKPQTVRNNKN